MAQNLTDAQTKQVKGALFEAIVRNLLMRSNFSPIPPDGRSVRHGFFNIRGRGCRHNIDACGKYDVSIPYVYPIRLLAEAKCHDDKIDLQTLQSFVGVVKDISENYFIKDRITSDERREFKRYTDCGAIFSSSDFTDEAQNFALAHGINLVSYANNPIIRAAVDAMNRLIQTLNVPHCAANKADFSKYIDYRLANPPMRTSKNNFVESTERRRFLEEFNSLSRVTNGVKTSLIGVAISKEKEFQYPIHMLSNQAFPTRNFARTDTQYFIPQFESTEAGLVFRIFLPNIQEGLDRQTLLYFSLPANVYQSYFRQRQMPQFKAAFMSEIEIPMKINAMRRVVRLEIDKKWLHEHNLAD